jgi:glycosyltransferase involved in cell wall biosynthesis
VSRPSVSVVVPFGGGPIDTLRATLGRLDRQSGDEVIVADNSAGGAAGLADIAQVVPARGERSSYHARNAGAAASRSGWILFIDADCTPVPGLLDAYFGGPIPEGVGAIAGEIVGDPDQSSLAARYARDRKVLSQTDGLYGRGRTVAATGNLLVRRAAFEELGGFVEGIRSGGDVDFCLRLQNAEWALDFRPQALVVHRHRDNLPALLATFARYGAGSRWLRSRYPGIGGRWPLSPRELARVGTDAARLTLRGDRQQAAFRLIDGLGLVAHNVGYVTSNRPGPQGAVPWRRASSSVRPAAASASARSR